MTELLADWRTRYDHIIFDTPPASMFTDGAVVGAQADAVLLVARCGVTTRHALRHARDILQRAHLSMLGLVLNGVDQRYERSYYMPFGHDLSATKAKPLGA
jgi:Mrp family chromosome partitioning ATPase